MDNKVLLYSYCIVFPLVNLSLTSRGLCGKACPNDANRTEWSATTCESAHGTVIVSLVRGLGQLSTPIFNIPSNYRPSIRDPPSLSVSLPCLTPSLPRPVKFPGWKTHGRACKQYIFRSCSTSTFNAMCFDENPFTCQRETEDKKASGFQISLILDVFKWLRGGEWVKDDGL